MVNTLTYWFGGRRCVAVALALAVVSWGRAYADNELASPSTTAARVVTPEQLLSLASIDAERSAEEVPAASSPKRFGRISSLSAGIGLPLPIRRVENELIAEKKALVDYAEAEFGKYGTLRFPISNPHRHTDAAVGPVTGEFCYRPLFFEEVNLERYGNHRGCLQPVVSAARFFATIPALPYLMTANHPEVCRVWNHPFQAGRPAPRVRELPEFDLRAGVVTGGVAAGLILLIP